MSRNTHNRPNSTIGRRLKMAAILVVLMAATVFAAEDSLFDTKSSFSAATLDFVGFDPAALSPAARDGLNEIFSGQMTYTPMPLSLSKAMDEAEAARKGELGYDPSTAKGRFYRSGSLPSPPNRGAAADISVGEAVFERNGAMLKTGNCFACHAGVVNGTVVAGLGNNSVMQGAPRPKNDASAKGPNMMSLAADLEPAEKAALAEIMKIGSGVRNPIPERTNRGDNYGPFGVWAHGAQLEDPETKGMTVSRAKTELTDVIENTMAAPVNPMPWWLMKYKTLDYWYGDGGPSDAAHFSFNFSSSHEKANELQANHVARTAKALTFARATVSPVFPAKLDAELVQKGADLFHDRTEPASTFGFRACYECHGTYTKTASTPDFSKPGSWTVDYVGTKLRNVNTDSAYNEATHAMRPVADHITKLAVYF